MITSRKTKISRVKSWSEKLELTRPYAISYRKIEAVENVFVYLETEQGLSGIGAGSPARYVTGENIDDTKSALTEKLEPLLLGKDIRTLPSLCRLLQKEMPGTPAARKAADIALHDILAKYLDIPLAEMLGQVYQYLPTSITIGIKESLEETIAEAREYVGREFKIIKLKIGKSPEQDIETTLKLREALGKSIAIRVDANQGYQPEDLIRYTEQTNSAGLELIEQPFHKDRVSDMEKIPEPLRKKCAADESLQSPADALRLAGIPQPFGIYNIKLTKCGGIHGALQIASIAALSGIALMWGCMDESLISITAALHTAFASPATRYIDLDGSLDLARDIASGGFRLKEGIMSINPQAGLGVQLINNTRR